MTEPSRVRPPADFWREVPCGHPPDPVAWNSPNGPVCHCGTDLDPAQGIDIPEAPGPVVLCQNCGCHVACPDTEQAEVQCKCGEHDPAVGGSRGAAGCPIHDPLAPSQLEKDKARVDLAERLEREADCETPPTSEWWNGQLEALLREAASTLTTYEQALEAAEAMERFIRDSRSLLSLAGAWNRAEAKLADFGSARAALERSKQ